MQHLYSYRSTLPLSTCSVCRTLWTWTMAENWLLNPLQVSCLDKRRHFQPLSANPCNIKQYLSISVSSLETRRWWDSFTHWWPHRWAIKRCTGMKTSGPCNTEIVLLHLAAAGFDRGVNCACVRFLCASTWAAQCVSVRESVGRSVKKTARDWCNYRVRSGLFYSVTS